MSRLIGVSLTPLRLEAIAAGFSRSAESTSPGRERPQVRHCNQEKLVGRSFGDDGGASPHRDRPTARTLLPQKSSSQTAGKFSDSRIRGLTRAGRVPLFCNVQEEFASGCNSLKHMSCSARHSLARTRRKRLTSAQCNREVNTRRGAKSGKRDENQCVGGSVSQSGKALPETPHFWSCRLVQLEAEPLEAGVERLAAHAEMQSHAALVAATHLVRGADRQAIVVARRLERRAHRETAGACWRSATLLRRAARPHAASDSRALGRCPASCASAAPLPHPRSAAGHRCRP